VEGAVFLTNTVKVLMYADTSTTRWINTSKRGNFADFSNKLKRSPSSETFLNFELALRPKVK
jgi:hypothetical protein